MQPGEEGFEEKKACYRAGAMETPVFIHGTSVLRRKAPDWVIYQELFETDKIYLRGVTRIEPEWLPVYCPAVCSMGQVEQVEPPPRYCLRTGRVMATMAGTFGTAGWPLPRTELELEEGVDRLVSTNFIATIVAIKF